MLPKDEMARLQHLPWIEHDAEANRKIAYAYAPESALLLDSIGDSRVWTQRTSWNEMVTALMHAKDRHGVALAIKEQQGCDIARSEMNILRA